MTINYLAKITLVSFISIAAVNIVSAQDGVKTRNITSDDFGNQRPVRAKTSGPKTVAPKPKRFRYKFVRVDRNAARVKSVKPTSKSAVKITSVGVTMWKMRPPKASETGQFLPVIDDKKMRQMWLAERIGVDTVFTAGDKIRFAIESSEPGYLYVFDRETYSDGSLGAPYLIFPESGLDDNAVGPGMIVDIPDQRDDVPYFNINPKNINYSGEMMTVIISPKPLENFKVDGEGKLANSTELTELEFGTEVELFTREDADDKMFSKAEAESTCGSKSRQSTDGQTDGKPCGIKTRQLTRDEPFPQSIFRVKSTVGQPAVAFVKLAVR